ncbi:methionine ABC transporter ATP-binding protein [Rosenbergiella collisarenosi]|uniref:methionine ABC transporter ATP-binding protein n=1 Tax=Rosenbergiella collisarenosi TaxID=1544695 RepID=UPI001BDA128F|nr:methionine ABC transporter ATP-binding protein [Rosenbergiella collisarenosi]MBT0719708.1 methionine ABC transporter ATP-binding protein [Rosenbergiella collisarenosi]
MISVENLSKEYLSAQGQRHTILENISLDVPAGSITAVVGPSGAGKSTLAKCISLLENPSRGRILVDGIDLSTLSGEALRRQRRLIGSVFQSAALLQRKTVWQNIALPLQWLGVVPHQITSHVNQLLESVGLTHKANVYPAQLSGGQQQRVGIARALALNPKVLLADEATSGLDPQTTQSIIALLKRLRDEYRLAIVVITHEMDVVRQAADAVACIEQGKLIQFGRVEQLLSSPHSLLANQLFPLTPLPSTKAIEVSLRYTAKMVTFDWVSRLAQQGILIDILAAHLENVAGCLVGRMRIAISPSAGFDIDHFVQQLHAWGLHLDHPLPLSVFQEAG